MGSGNQTRKGTRISFVFWDGISWIPDWPKISCVAKDELELVTFLPFFFFFFNPRTGIIDMPKQLTKVMVLRIKCVQQKEGSSLLFGWLYKLSKSPFLPTYVWRQPSLELAQKAHIRTYWDWLCSCPLLLANCWFQGYKMTSPENTDPRLFGAVFFSPLGPTLCFLALI